VTCCVNSNYRVLNIHAVGNDLFASGEFNEMGGTAGTGGIARWDGRRWHSLGGGLRKSGALNGEAYDIAVSGENLYVVGDFDRVGELNVGGIARWHIPTQTWHAVGNGAGPRDEVGLATAPITVAVEGNDLFIGGNFYSIDGVDVYSVAHWNGTRWSSLNDGVFDRRDILNDGGFVNDIAIAGDQVYVGGRFAFAGNAGSDLSVSNIAAWSRSGGSWAALDGGTSAEVRSLAVDGATLYAGGAFASAGGQQVNKVARWDGTQWSGLGSGTPGLVVWLTFAQGALYASGNFFEMGGVPNTNSIARWDGAQWQSLRSDLLLSNPQEDLALTVGVLPNGHVVAGGVFSSDGAPLFNHIAIFDGTRWQGTGLGLDNPSAGPSGSIGSAVAVNGAGQVFVAGGFSTLGGLPADGIAMWDGAGWRSIGGVNGQIYTMLVRGEELFVGGNFTQVGGMSASKVAKYNMATGQWAALGDGLPRGAVYALAFVGNTLYAGGGAFGGAVDCCLWKFDGATWAPFSERFQTNLFIINVGPNLFQTTIQALAGDDRYLLVGGQYLDVKRRGEDQKIIAGDLFVYDTVADSITLFSSGDSVGVDNGGSLAAVRAITIGSDGIYVGGEFRSVVGVPANNIARLNAGTWSALGPGVQGEDPSVNTLVANGGDLYVGGRFESAGTEAFNIARWNSASGQWSALGCGTDGPIVALEMQSPGLPNTGLYVAGNFDEAGCKPASGFAIWYGVGPGGVVPGELDKRLFLPITRR
jgi:hypothetical protein